MKTGAEEAKCCILRYVLKLCRNLDYLHSLALQYWRLKVHNQLHGLAGEVAIDGIRCGLKSLMQREFYKQGLCYCGLSIHNAVDDEVRHMTHGRFKDGSCATSCDDDGVCRQVTESEAWQDEGRRVTPLLIIA